MSTAPDDLERLRSRWAARGDLAAIEAQLRARGSDPDQLTLADLNMIDQFHSGQLETTRVFARWVSPDPGARVLDLGAGLGGSARTLACEHGCQVVAVELVAELHETALELTRRLGWTESVTQRCGDAMAVDPGHDPFDLVWLQHVDMHVADKNTLYRRCAAALAPGGRVVWHDWLAGRGGPPRYPTPWSHTGRISHLARPARFRQSLAAAGLAERRFESISEQTRTWFAATGDGLRRVLKEPEVKGRARLEQVLLEIDNVLINLEQERLLPFFGEAGF